MPTNSLKNDRELLTREKVPLMLAALFLAFVLLVGPAFAGTDTTFDSAFTKFSGYLEGSGGKVISLLALVGGLVALASGQFRLNQVAVPVGVAIGVSTGIPIVTSAVTAII